MLKGEISIELTNKDTGEKRVIEGHNMVTNALSKLVSILSAGALADSLTSFPKIGVPATFLLGGLAIYGDNLTENANNIELKWDAPIIGKAGQYSSTDIRRGVYNTEESGKLSTGYKHVWDFLTSQCNGTIKALALCPAYGTDDTLHDYNIGRETTAGQLGRPLWYDEDNNELYSYKQTASGSNYVINIYKLKLPNVPLKVGEAFLNTDAVMDSSTLYDTLTFTANQPLGSCYDANTNKAYIYTYQGTQILVFNCSTKAASIQSVTLPIAKDTSYYQYYAGVYNGYYYYVSASGNYFVRVNINDSTDYHEFTELVAVYSNTEVRSAIDGIGIRLGNAYYKIYPNDTYDTVTNFDGPGNQLSTFYRWYSYNSLCYFAPSFKQRMTIFNLSTAVTKTAEDTMKIIYTLTDA